MCGSKGKFSSDLPNMAEVSTYDKKHTSFLLIILSQLTVITVKTLSCPCCHTVMPLIATTTHLFVSNIKRYCLPKESPNVCDWLFAMPGGFSWLQENTVLICFGHTIQVPLLKHCRTIWNELLHSSWIISWTIFTLPVWSQKESIARSEWPRKGRLPPLTSQSASYQKTM